MNKRRSIQVRAVVTTQFGCQERSAWYEEGSSESIEAMQALAKKQTGPFSIDWEERDDIEADSIE